MTKSEFPRMRLYIDNGLTGHFAFTLVAEPGRSNPERHPPCAADFMLHFRSDFSDASRVVFHEVEGNDLEYLLSVLPFAGVNIPDAAQAGHRTRFNAGLFQHFTDRRLFGGFVRIDVAFGQGNDVSA